MIVVFFKKTVVNSCNRRYIYGQLVKSVRREADGKPGHIVVAKLGRMDEQLANNLQLAFRAAHEGKAVVLTDQVQHQAIQTVAHYQYLDVAVLLEEWRRWKLGELLQDTGPKTNATVPFEDVTALLVFNRCIDPNSKIEATRWHRETALPELLGHPIETINNTRVHRALSSLAKAEEELQRKLAAAIQIKRGANRAFFIDVTDTWFEGKGPDLAEGRKTKEGLWKLKIGIVLVCTDEGLPLRWKVVAGRCAEQQVMLDAATWLDHCGLFHNELVVVDRAMGHVKTIADMKAAGIKYLTALRSQAIEQFVGQHPAFGLGDGVELDAPDALEQLRLVAERNAMVDAGDGLYAMPLGVITPKISKDREPSPHVQRSQDALALSKALQLRLKEGQAPTLKEAARQLGIQPPKASSVRLLLKLHPQIQQTIEAGANSLSVVQLKKLAKLAEAEQLKRYGLQHSEVEESPDAASQIVLFFHPKRFLARRKETRAKCKLLEQQLDDLNRRLASPQSRRRPGSIENEIRNKFLKPNEFTALFDIEIQHIDQDGREIQQARLVPNEAWRDTRKRDGFLVLAAHPDSKAAPSSLAELYSAKNIIEEDFHVIKSPLKLRPVYVHTDPKVRAHVSVCMLGLLLRRSIELQMNNRQTACKTLKALSKVYLNAQSIAGVKNTGAYSLTVPNPRQRAILAQLGMETLVEEKCLPELLVAR